MKKIFTTVALVCCILVCFAIVANMTGKWTGSIKTPDGNDFPLTYVLKVDGDKITGTAQSPQGEVPISNGKMTGTDFSFNLDVNGTDVKHTGKYYAAADTAGLDIDFNGQKFHSTLKRSADK
jgi:hypothetical protein